MSEKFHFKMATIEALKQLLPDVGQVPFKVVNAFPTKANQFPCVSVTRKEGGVEREVIGQEWATEYADEETGEPMVAEGCYYRQSLEVVLWTGNPNLRDEIEPLVTASLWRLFKAFSDRHDLAELKLRDEGDGQDFDGQAPADVFLFTWHFSALVPLVNEIPLASTSGDDINIVVTYP